MSKTASLACSKETIGGVVSPSPGWQSLKSWLPLTGTLFQIEMQHSKPQVTLVIGGPGSGKTEEIVARLDDGFSGGRIWNVLLLTPTVRHADQLRRRLVAKCGVAMGLRVDGLARFGQRIVGDRVDSAIHAPVADELLARITRAEVDAGDASYFKPILGTKGLGRLVRAAVLNLVSEAVDPGQFRSSANKSGIPALQALSAIYAAYLADLDHRGWTHPAAQSYEAAKAVDEGATLPELIVLDGFQLLRGSELALLKAVSRRTPLLLSIDPDAGTRAAYDYRRLLSLFPQAKIINIDDSNSTAPPSVLGAESADHEAQIRDVARFIKRKLVEDPELRPSDFAVAFRQIAPHLSLARQVFAEYQLPLDPLSGITLRDSPLGAWLRRLLHIGTEGWRLTDATAVLESGYINLRRWNLTREDVYTFTRLARKTNLWRDHSNLLKATISLENSRAQAGLRQALEDLRFLLEAPAASLGERALQWDDALFGESPLINPNSLERPDVQAGVDLIRQLLREIVYVQKALGGRQASFEAFAAWLEARMEAPSLLLRDVGGVVLAPIRALAGLRFHSVIIGGLVESEFPAPRASTALLGEQALVALASAGLQLPPEPGLSEDELWDSASSRADNILYLWKTRLDSRGRPASGSYYYDLLKPTCLPLPPFSTHIASSLRELAIACTAQWHLGGAFRPAVFEAWPTVKESVRVEQRRRSFSHAAMYEGLLPSGLVSNLTRPEAPWSASRMESYLTCPFQFFGRYGLGLNELDEEKTEPDAATRGSVIHEVLESALGPLRDSELPLNSDTLDETLERLRQQGPTIWNTAPSRYGFGAVNTWELDWQNSLERLELMLSFEASFSSERGVQRIRGIELNLIADLPLDPPLKLRAYIDRLDVGQDGLVVVDYKSGQYISRNRLEEAERLQLQLYALLASSVEGVDDVVARYAWMNPGHKKWSLDSSDEEDNRLIQDALITAGRVRNSVDAGDFRVFPKPDKCPSYCAFKHACRVNEFSRWKRWQ